MTPRFTLLGRMSILVLLVIFGTLGWAAAASAASVTTDTTDYPPGSTVQIYGTDFSPGETVTVHVTHDDGDPPGGEGHDPWDVVADGFGSFYTTWYVPYDDHVGETLLLTATGQTSGLADSTTFTDNIGTNLDQLQNGTLTKSAEWANGNINSQNSCYAEGDGVPFRYFLTGTEGGQKVRFTVQMEWTKGGIHAYDYPVDFDITEATALAAVGGVCGSIATSPPIDCDATLASFMFPDPTNSANYDVTLGDMVDPDTMSEFFQPGFSLDSPANMHTYNATVDSMGPYFFTGTSSDRELNMYVYATVTDTGSVGFFWAGHLAEGAPGAWGFGNGAASVGGAPYHMRGIDLKEIINNVPEGSGAQNQDRSIQNGTICLPPDPTISCVSNNLPCSDLSSYCFAPVGADTYDWVVSGANVDSFSVFGDTVYYTAFDDTVFLSLTVCNTSGGCPGDFCCLTDSTFVEAEIDRTPPVIGQCPPDTDLGCNPDSIPEADPGPLVVSDPCGAVGVSVDTLPDVVNGCMITRTYRFYVTDASGNIDSCDQILTWTEDVTAPVFTLCPADEDLGCNPVVPDAAAGDATATDDCGVAVVTVVQGTPSNVGCLWTRTDVWTATDDCGNTEVCSRTYTWTVDVTGPLFTLCPADEDLGCNPVVPDAAAGDATATDDCGTPTVTVVQGTVTNVGCVYSRTDVWTATDDCGNSETCSRTYTWTEDVTAPVFSLCPSDEDLGCNPTVPDAAAGDATATDNCGDPTVTVAQGTESNVGCVYSRTDVWTATDDCGNTEVCSRTYTWTVDVTAPEFTVCPADEDLGCNPTVPDAAAGDATATDDCGDPTVTVAQGTESNVGCVYSRTDVWTATDDCGNTETCSRTYTWTVDVTAPVFSLCPGDEDLGCNPTVPDAAAGDATATDNCGDPTVTVAQGTESNVGCVYSRTDVWTATDDCGNTETCSRTYTWTVDDVAPVFSLCPSDEDLGCNPTVPDAAAGDATATDNCGDPTVTVAQGTPSNGGAGCVWTRTDVWTATDDCGNTETCSRTYTWTVDADPPVFTLCPDDEELGCNPTVPDAAAGDATATDNCGDPTVTVAQGTPSNGGAGCVWTRTDVWTATDDCGNSETCSRTYTWTVDDVAPVFSLCPSDEDLGCNPTVPDAAAGDATATDNCGDPTVTVAQGTPSNGGAGCVWTRTDVWTATDDCGNSETCSRTYTWTVDDVAPVFSLCPSDEDLGCNPTVPDAAAGDATATDNCGDPTVTVAQGTPSNGGAGCVWTRTDVWTATDDCGNSETCSRTYTWTVDDVAPVFSLCPSDEDLGCNPTVPDAAAGDATATDNCGDPTVTVAQGTPSNGGAGCVWTRTDVWTATDDCGNSETCSRTYTWTVDDVAPVFSLCPSDEDLGCNPTVPDAAAGDATATDNCGDPTVTVAQGTESNVGCVYSRTDVWTATDDCGNTETCSRTYTWTEDDAAPSFTSCPSDQDLGCNPASIPGASAGDATATDNCGTPAVTVAQGTPSQNGCNWSRTDVWTATDDCGNSQTCSRTFTWIEDLTAPTFSFCPLDKSIPCDTLWVFDLPTVFDLCDVFAQPVMVRVDTTLGPNSGDTTYTASWVATDACGNTSDTCKQAVIQEACTDGQGCSFTIGGWGSGCPPPQQGDMLSTQPGCVRDHYFDAVFPNGLTLGNLATNYATWTSAMAIEDYLPDGSGPRLLVGQLINPTTTSANVLGSQLVALKLNAAYSCAGVFADLGIADPGFCYGARLVPAECAGPFAGLTVNQFLALADDVIAGDLALLDPYSATLTDLNLVASCMNELFDNCDPLAPEVSLLELQAAGIDLGDVNDDGRHSSADLVEMIMYIFKGGAEPQPYKEVVDFNYDYKGNSGDIVELVNYLFRGGTPVR